MRCLIASILVSLLVLSGGVIAFERSQYTMGSDGPLPTSQQGLLLQHAELHFTILPKEKAINGTGILTLVSDHSRNNVGINLDNFFSINKVLINSKIIDENQYSNPEGLLLINLPNKIKGKFTVEIHYSDVPREAVKAPWDGGFVWAKTSSGKDWIATAVQGEGCDLFWPCIDNPIGEPKTTTMHITVPKGLVAAANGTLQSVTKGETTDTYHWKALSQLNTYGVAINVGPYEVIKTTFNSQYGNEIPVEFYHLPENKEGAKKLVQELLDITTFFERKIGPYPFGQDKIGVVDTPHLGMEHQTINAYGNNYITDKYGFDWLMFHEFAHEWFANQLTNKNANAMWLHEGFGAYMHPLYEYYLHGQTAYMSHMFDMRLKVRNKAPIVSKKLLTVEGVYQEEKGGPGADIYAKAPWVLHTLRNIIGDEHFFNATTELVYGTAKPTPGNFKPVLADTEDFLRIVNRLTGKDFKWFFDVYFYQAKLPEIMQTKTDNRLTLQWKTPNDLPFPLPLDVSVNGKMLTLDLTHPQTIEVLPNDLVIIDPMSKVLIDKPHVADYQHFIKENAK
ncbi:M1 family metallopeptidase [Thalassotalea sp. 1_MG-2023]|uniref:M1 family metallopeptidase n=1 Tax=Thalassotalea sp. 1_MG-2023 TaxID=3062680 RepID=UPI0026E1B9A2|nr:M1 family metallopeptidase [Thalassotalea sp. 1_MG-2023]MDO6428260.1 M1 family metallopeptidase [Thalassotalea sp. 1_MG-2023]